MLLQTHALARTLAWPGGVAPRPDSANGRAALSPEHGMWSVARADVGRYTYRTRREKVNQLQQARGSSGRRAQGA